MKRNLRILLTATTASLLTLPVIAQQPTAPKSDRPGQAREGMTSATAAREGMASANSDRMLGAAKASDLIGMTVNNHQDEKLGTVDDLAVDLESGRIVQVILSTGGFVGMGDRLSAVPPGALRYDKESKMLHLDANKDKLKRAPEFKAAQWDESSDVTHLTAVYSYYGQESSMKFIDNADTAAISTNRNAQGTQKGARAMGEGQWMIPASRLGQVQRASKLMGLEVKNAQAEEIGTVDNLLVDVQSGRIIAVVVSSGGFLGTGDELSAVPPTAFGFNAERDTLQLDVTKDAMSAAPRFKSDQWPDFTESGYSEGVYRAYKKEPYFSSMAGNDNRTSRGMNAAMDNGANARTNGDNTRNASTQAGTRDDANRGMSAGMNNGTNARADADNSARNERDRNDRTATPMDQGNSKADTDTTAEIRKGILAGADMSVNARNVKIITNNGRVSLRGPVKNEEEKRMIGEVANRIARSENVDNQLEVAR